LTEISAYGGITFRTPDGYAGWLDVQLKDVTVGTSVMIFAQGTGETPFYSLLLQDATLGSVTFDTTDAQVAVNVFGTLVVEPGATYATASVGSISTTEANSVVRLQGATVLSGS
jgi:hypothetical protein